MDAAIIVGGLVTAMELLDEILKAVRSEGDLSDEQKQAIDDRSRAALDETRRLLEERNPT